jgi:peptidylprolyl isomerase
VIEAVKAKEERVRKRNKALWIGVPAAIVIALAIFRPWDSSSSSVAENAQDSSGLTVSTNPTTTQVPVTISPALSTKPVVEVPAGDPPKELQIKDLVTGTGPEAVAGSTVRVQYVGVSWTSKKQFDASWDRGLAPFDVTDLGNAPVIKGWNQGLLGAKKGSRRQLIIPPALAYGDAPTNPSIAKNDTLIFVVDLLDVLPPAGAATTTAAPAAAATTTTAAATTTAG